MLLVLLGSQLFPLREGRALGSLVWQVVAAPMYPIDLRSVLVGDVLTSMVKPLQVPVPHATRPASAHDARHGRLSLRPPAFYGSLSDPPLPATVLRTKDVVYSACFVSTMEWTLPSAEQGACHDSRVYHNVLVPLFCALPLWWRFMQCLRVFHDSQQRIPALPNALKYSVSLLVVLFGAVHPALMSVAGAPRMLTWGSMGVWEHGRGHRGGEGEGEGV